MIQNEFEARVRRVVTVTLQVGREQVPVRLPSEVPISQLVEELVARHVPGAAGDHPAFQLGTTWGRPFGPETSLAENGIFDGSVVVLAQTRHWIEREAELGSTSEPQTPYPPPVAVQAPVSGGAADQAWPSGPPWAAAAPAEVPAAPPVSEAEPVASLLPQDLTEIQLPAQPQLSQRLRGVARAVLRPEGELRQPAAAPEAPRPDRPINPEHLSHDQLPGALARARQAWREGSYRWELERRIAAPRLRRCLTIAVISPKGGVGKTTVTALLGTLLSMIRHDRIVAIDANPDFGSLGRILTAHHDVYVDDLAEVLDDPQLTITALDQNLGRTAHSLMVLPAPLDPARMEGLDEAVYSRVMARLRQMVGVILLDCGTGLHDPASKAAIAAADQVLLVSDPDPATASLVVSAANLLHQRGLQIWLVVNKVPRQRSRLDLRVFGAHLAYARGLVTLPLETAGVEALASGSFDWDLAPRRLRNGISELAMDLISAWPELGVC